MCHFAYSRSVDYDANTIFLLFQPSIMLKNKFIIDLHIKFFYFINILSILKSNGNEVVLETMLNVEKTMQK